MSAAIVSVCLAAALAVGGPVPVIAAVHAQPATPVPAPTEAAPAPTPVPTPAPNAQSSSSGAPEAVAAPSEPAPAEPTDPAAAAPAPTISLQPAPAPTVAPTVAVQPAPTPDSLPPSRPIADPRTVDALVISGAVATALGGVSLLLVSLPARGVRSSALRRAEREDALAFTSRRTRYERARRADDVMEGAFWVGLPLVVTGVALLATGLAIRANARARARMAAIPGGLAIRF